MTEQEQEVYDWTLRVLTDAAAATTPEFLEFSKRVFPAFRTGEADSLAAASTAAREAYAQGARL